MTNHWVDIKNANLVVVMGGNAAEAHPVGFRWAMEAKIHNGAKLIVIDPRFTRTAAVADYYAPIRSGTDIAFLSGVLLYLLNNEKFNREYTEAYTNASLIVREGPGKRHCRNLCKGAQPHQRLRPASGCSLPVRR